MRSCPVRSATCCPPRPRCSGSRARSTGWGWRIRSATVDRVAVVLVDGMGWHLLPELAGDAPLLASVLAGGAGRLSQLVCTFPSTTPTSLVSLGTGAQPGEHGILGFTLNIPGTDRVLTHIRWRDDPPPHRMAAAARPGSSGWQRAGVGARAVLPASFIGSGLTDAAYRGARFLPDAPDRRLCPASGRRAARGAGTGLRLHRRPGHRGPRVRHRLARSGTRRRPGVDALLTRLVEALPPNAALLVTADHGGLNVPPDARIDLDTDPRLGAGVRVVAGEPRVRYLHTEPGAAADVQATWSEAAGRPGRGLQPRAGGGHRDVRAGQTRAPGADRRCRRRLHRRRGGAGDRHTSPRKRLASSAFTARPPRPKWRFR